MLKLETIKKETIWVAKMIGCRFTGTYDELKGLASSEECRDFDIVWSGGQPEHLRPFYEAYEKYEAKNGFTFIDDFYKVYAEGAC